MNIPGPLSVSPLNPSSGQELNFRPFQRVTAQILAITGTMAILSIDGYPVVAQLSSSDQATTLLSQRSAQFIVTQSDSQSVTLKFVKSDQNQPTPASGTITLSPGTDLAARLLDQNGIPLNENSLILARSALKQHLPVTPDLLNELLGALQESGTWGEAEAELATAMKAAGLPVTAQSLALAAHQSAQVGENVSNLINLMSDAVKQNLPEETLQLLNATLQNLKESGVKWDGAPAQIAKQLKDSVILLGKSLENILLSRSSNPEAAAASPEAGLMTLVKLQQALQQAGQTKLAEAVDKLLVDLRQNQLMNVKPDPVPGRGEWSQIGFMLQNTQQKEINDFSSARFKVAHEGGPEPGKINPAYTRLIIQVDLSPTETVEVDISVVGKQIRTAMTAPDPEWVKNAQTELPTLEEALKNLGFVMQDTQIGVGYPRPFGGLSPTSGGAPRMTVDIEV